MDNKDGWKTDVQKAREVTDSSLKVVFWLSTAFRVVIQGKEMDCASGHIANG